MLPSKIQQQFEGWEVDLDPENFNLLSLLKFRQSKGDFSFKKSVEHTLISKFVSYVEGSADEKWRKAASLLNGRVLSQARWESVKLFWQNIGLEKENYEHRSKQSAKRPMAASREDEESESEDGDSAHPMAAGKTTLPASEEDEQVDLPLLNSRMDVSGTIARYLNDVAFSKWSVTGCLEFLAESSMWVTSERREEIMNEFKRQMEIISTHQSLVQKARNKAAKLSSDAEKVFQFAEVTAFFDRMDKEVNERLLNIKRNLYGSEVKVQVVGDKLAILRSEASSVSNSATTPVEDVLSLVTPSASNSATTLVNSGSPEKRKRELSDVHTQDFTNSARKRRQAQGEVVSVKKRVTMDDNDETPFLQRNQNRSLSSSEEETEGSTVLVDDGYTTPPAQNSPQYDGWTNIRLGAVSDELDVDEPNEEPVNVINLEKVVATHTQWLLRDGRDVRSIFEEYRDGVGKIDFIAQCHIMEIVETAPIRRCKFGDDEAAWLEVCATMEAKWDTHKPSSHASQYLESLMMASVKETRQALMVPYCSTSYDVQEHYDLNYIHTVVNKFITFFETPNNPLLDADNSEGFLQAHVFSLLIDQLFFDLPAVQVVRGEKASRAVSYRKNAQRQLGTTKLSAVKLDSALLTRDAWRVELLTMEASRTDCIEGQTKQLSDMRKLARALKDQLDFIYTRLPESQRHRIVDVEVFGILISGLEGRVYAIDLPCSGLYRFAELFRFEVPKQFDSYFLLVKTLARMLALKQRVRGVLSNLQDIKLSAARETLLGDGLLWSPKRPLESHLTRSTPVTPATRNGSK